MTTISVDATTRERLVEPAGLVAVTGPDGAVIGFFAPHTLEHAQQYAELAARAYAAHRDGRRPVTTAELAQQLDALETAKRDSRSSGRRSPRTSWP